MNELRENIITISGTQENLFDKAIFIIKPEKQSEVSSLDFSREADKILNNYMLQAVADLQKSNNLSKEQIVTKTTTQKNKRTKQDALIDRMLGFSVLFCILVVSLIILV